MFIGIKKATQVYTRDSKLGGRHTYTRKKSVVILKCDACETEFERDLARINKKRLNNDYYHVCSQCDVKRFAQEKGVERRRIWNMPIDSDIEIDRL
jgi:hypothetical protein